MANVTVGDVLRLAKLSKLELTDDELNDFSHDLTQIIEYVEQLAQVNLDGLEPTSQVTGLSNVTRADEIIDYGVTPALLLKNVPATEHNYIKTKRILN